MATKGNLELRTGKESFMCSTTHDGYSVYLAVPEFCRFLDENSKPTKEKYFAWAREFGEEFLSHNYSESLIGGVPCEVIIDIGRKLILHNATADELELIRIWGQEPLTKSFDYGIRRLRRKHNYQALRFTNEAVRETLAGMKKGGGMI